MRKQESVYQASLVKKLYQMFPGCIIQEQDPSRTQGIPDLLILYKDKWASLEVKISASAPVRPNQRHHVDTMNSM